MEITIRSGKRGRPLTINTEQILKDYLRYKPKAVKRLQEFRRTTSGERTEEILGSETTLPKAMETMQDVIDALQSGTKINYQTAKELRANLRTVRQLASNQYRVYGRALAEQLSNKYLQDLETQSLNASKTAKKIYKKLGENVKQLTAQQKQKFFMSKSYQSPKTNYKSYQHAKEWAKNDIKRQTGKESRLTGEEALAYIELKKQEEFIGKL